MPTLRFSDRPDAKVARARTNIQDRTVPKVGVVRAREGANRQISKNPDGTVDLEERPRGRRTEENRPIGLSRLSWLANEWGASHRLTRRPIYQLGPPLTHRPTRLVL